MATRSYNIPMPGFAGVYKKLYSNTSTNSPKVDGKLVLGNNAHSFIDSTVTSWRPKGSLRTQGAESYPSFTFTPAMYNQVYSQWQGKLRNRDGASLGVTLGSWAQSRSMIIDRSRKLYRFFSLVERTHRRKPWLYRKRDLASDFLEGEFGWVPLLGDIVNAVKTVANDVPPPGFVRASRVFTRNETIDHSGPENGTVRSIQTFTGRGRITIASKVTVSNPNLWLANKLGLLNVAGVAWDLVPWSFVVNIFVNVNQVVGALTDTIGLDIAGSSVTRSSTILMEHNAWITADYGGQPKGTSYGSSVLGKRRDREPGPVPAPTLTVRMPNVNFELAAIAAALVTQKVKSL